MTAKDIDRSCLRVGPQAYRRDTDEALRLVYIPTHRPFQLVLDRVVDEIHRTADSVPDEFQLLLIDDRPGPLDADNRAAATQAANSAKFAVNWMGQAEWSEFVDHLTGHGELDLKQANLVRAGLLKPSGSYAGGMNKASLVAAFLGASTLHRRDSDEFPGYSTKDDITALHLEAVTLDGGPLNSVTWEGERPYFVGSHVRGQPTKDHRDLRVLSAGLEDDLERISSRRTKVAAPTRSDAQLQVLQMGGGVRLERDNSGRTEVGVSACRKVFEWIPEMPAVGVLGTDHFQKGLLYQLDLPVVWHPLAATHVYDAQRLEQRDIAAIRWYAIAELRYSVLRQYWNAANDTLWAKRFELLPQHGQFMADGYANAFRSSLDSETSKPKSAARAFIEVHQRAYDLATDDVRARHRARLEALEEAEQGVDDYVRGAIWEFAELARIWPRLIGVARSMRPGRMKL